MQSIHIRQPEIEDRVIPGHWEGERFSAVMKREPEIFRKSMTYDRGHKMPGHKTLTERTGVHIYLADPHSRWQRGPHENTNGLLRQYPPKGSDLAIYSQEKPDAIALSLKPTRGWTTLSVVYTEPMLKRQLQAESIH